MRANVELGRRRLLLVMAAVVSACSADAVEVPDPTLQTSGSFVAVKSSTGEGFHLLRTVMALTLDNAKVVLFMLRYPEMPKDLETARALARGAPLEHVSVELLLEQDLVAQGSEVVWFRTLTDEERNAAT